MALVPASRSYKHHRGYQTVVPAVFDIPLRTGFHFIRRRKDRRFSVLREVLSTSSTTLGGSQVLLAHGCSETPRLVMIYCVFRVGILGKGYFR